MLTAISAKLLKDVDDCPPSRLMAMPTDTCGTTVMTLFTLKFDLVRCLGADERRLPPVRHSAVQSSRNCMDVFMELEEGKRTPIRRPLGFSYVLSESVDRDSHPLAHFVVCQAVVAAKGECQGIS